MFSYKYHLLATGGTFDRLHRGHRAFLTRAFMLSEKVIIGVTSDKFAEKKGEGLTSYKSRVEELKKWLQESGLWDRTKIAKLEGVYNPKVLDNRVEAILITEDTRKGAEVINIERVKMGIAPLFIEKIDFVFAGDRKTISSTRIRRGEIDREGFSYFTYKFNGGYLPEILRSSLQKPLGVLLKGHIDEPNFLAGRIKRLIKKAKPVFAVVVGDVVTKVFNDEKIPFDLSLVDLKINRKKVYSNLYDLGFNIPLGGKSSLSTYVTLSRPGYLSRPLFKTVKKAFSDLKKTSQKGVVYIKGEEDLSALPAILYAPLNTLVFYGQPHKVSPDGQGGVTVIRVEEEVKAKILELLRQFRKGI